MLCESRGGRPGPGPGPGLPVHNSPYGLCGRKATFTCETASPSTHFCKKSLFVLFFRDRHLQWATYMQIASLGGAGYIKDFYKAK